MYMCINILQYIYIYIYKYIWYICVYLHTGFLFMVYLAPNLNRVTSVHLNTWWRIKSQQSQCFAQVQKKSKKNVGGVMVLAIR